MKKLWMVGLLCVMFLFGCGNSNLDINKQSKQLNTYQMDLTYTEEHMLNGNETLTYTNRTDTTLSFLCFHLYPKAFSEGAVNKPVSTLNEKKAYPNGFSAGDIVINFAKVNGVDATFEYSGTDNNILKLFLGFDLEPLDKVTVLIDFTVQVPNVNHRFGYGENTVNLANFYPIVAVFENGEFILDPYNSNGDPFYSDMSNYEVKLTVPTEFVVSSTGEQTSAVKEESISTYYLNAKTVRDFAIVLSTKFEVLSNTVDDTLVTYYYYNDDNAQENLQTALDSVKTFNKLFGKYPYKTLNVVKTNFGHGGMEYPNLVYISDEVTGADYKNVIVHEIAHQWWYGVIGSNAFRNAWLDEGLTEYSTALFYEENPDYGIDYNELIKSTNNSYVTFVDLYTEILGKLDTSMNRHIDQYGTEPEYVYMTYVKGMLLFDNLREVVGKNNFLNGLKAYYSENAFNNVNPDNFIAAMEKTCKRELRNYINSWIEGKFVIVSKP